MTRTVYKIQGSYTPMMPYPTPPYPYATQNSSMDNAFFGKGVNMKAVYMQDEGKMNTTCVYDGSVNISDFCAVTSRNTPPSFTRAQITVFPKTFKHVQYAVKFARKHNLCISVAGTGHDFNSRHSNGNSLLIRTILMKSVDFDLSNRKRFSNADAGSVTFGPGIIWAEAYEYAERHRRVISGGGCPTVGVVGFSTVGRFGYLASEFGLGADNILEVELINAQGERIVANETNEHADLWWALRGGSGSTWGVIVSITIRVYHATKIGYQVTFINGNFDLCPMDTSCLCFSREATLVRNLDHPDVEGYHARGRIPVSV